MKKFDLRQMVEKNQFAVNYRRMWPFIKPFWPMALLSLLICVPVGSLDAVIALFLKPYTDVVVVGKSMESPWYIPLLIVGFTTVQGLLNFGGTYLNTWVGGRLTMGLKARLYEKLVDIEPSYFDTTTSGEVLFRFNSDAELACSGLLGNLKSFLTRICSSLALICVLFYNSWQLSILAIVILVVAVAPLTKVKKLLMTLVTRNNTCMFQLNTTYNETFSGNRTIAAYNLQERQKSRFNSLLNDVFTLTVAMTRRTAWITPFMHFVVSIGLGLAIAMGSWLIVQGTISPGNFVSFITALLMLYTPLKNITNVAVSVQQSFLAIDRVFSILERPKALKEKDETVPLPAIKQGITFEHVSFSYKKGVEVLHDINLDVRVGEMLALVGNSGGGKSTLVSLIPRFYDVTKGHIRVDGTDIREFALNDLRQHIAMVFQDNFLFDGTIRENILLGNPSASDEDVKKALHNACLSEFIDSLEKGVDTYIGERGILLSGGQKQRVAIARAFLKNAPIVILDEATSALDNKSEEIVQRAIDNLMRDKTVFVIAHRLSTVKNANRIAVIHEGRLAELGTHEELMAIPGGQYRTLYNMQFKAPIHHGKTEQKTEEVA
ncbi:ABC transporter transmembrane domain-containing protein [uncultured Mailhella sp.]|uniref:ABC transporter ATP-binding protein n=1 Tax=uncultured Mailhella sp. TaxID=1981031 RepID=UPI0025D9A291|nr:ABC transporter transmembrane domain-containing protein [uncultured Mailhella sp.]